MPLLCTVVEFELLEGLVMSPRGKSAMEARGLSTAHLGGHLPTPQEGTTGVSLFRGFYKARGARRRLASWPVEGAAFLGHVRRPGEGRVRVRVVRVSGEW